MEQYIYNMRTQKEQQKDWYIIMSLSDKHKKTRKLVTLSPLQEIENHRDTISINEQIFASTLNKVHKFTNRWISVRVSFLVCSTKFPAMPGTKTHKNFELINRLQSTVAQIETNKSTRTQRHEMVNQSQRLNLAEYSRSKIIVR